MIEDVVLAVPNPKRRMTGFSTGSSGIERLREILRSSRRAVVFTGAGVSTESGIPDYRSPGGIWSRFRPIDFDEFMTSEEARREYWRRKFDTHETVMEAKPNRGHLAIAELVRGRKVAAVITQNIEGLHQASGVPRDQVIELHGNTTYAHCLSCGKEYDLEPIRQAFLKDESLPDSTACGVFVNTTTISFRQAMPQKRCDARRRRRGRAICSSPSGLHSKSIRPRGSQLWRSKLAPAWSSSIGSRPTSTISRIWSSTGRSGRRCRLLSTGNGQAACSEC